MGFEKLALFARPPIFSLIKPDDIAKNFNKSLFDSTGLFLDQKLQTGLAKLDN